MAKVEPYVRVNERVRDFPARLNIDESTNIGGVVVSPKGKLYQYISGPNDFLTKLVGAEELPRDSHISLINAYYCSYFAGLVVARSLNTKATAAVRIPLNTDGSINASILVGNIRYQRSKDNDLMIGDVKYYAWTDGTSYVYTLTETVTTGSDLYYFPFTNYEITAVGTGVIMVSDGNTYTRTASGDVTVNGTNYYAWVYGDVTLYTTSTTPAVGNTVYFIPFSDKEISAVGDEYAYITVETVDYNRSSDDDIEANGHTYYAWVNNTKTYYTLETAPTTSSLLVEVPFQLGELSVDNSNWYIKMLGEAFLNSATELNLNLPIQSPSGTTNWAVRINDTLFYYGDDAFLENTLAIDPVFENDFNKLVKEEVETVYDVIAIINSWNGYSASVIGSPVNDYTAAVHIDFNTPNGIAPNTIFKITYSETVAGANIIKYISGQEPSTTLIDEPTNYFLIKLDEPSAYNDWKVSLTPRPSSRTGVSRLAISRDGGMSYERYDVSINKEAKGESGNNCFIENLNVGLKGIQFNVVGEYDLTSATVYPSFETKLFGDSGVDIKLCRKASSMSSAIYTLAEQKEFRIEYLSPFGVTDSTFLKDYQYVGAKNFWFCPIDVPYTYTTGTSIGIFSNAMNDNNNNIVMGPFDKNTAFLGWPCYIACTSKYYERVFINKSNNKEYAPAFEQTNGVLSFSDPVLLLGDTDRTSLLNGTAGPAVWLVYNQALNIYYLNDNWCHTTTDNIMSEEMNRRMINRIKKDAIQIMNRFKGRVNTSSTRAEVEDLLKIYMNNTIMSQDYKPEEYQVVCNESNNTTEIITANKLAVTLRVRLLGSIKYIDVLVDIFPLGVDFES